MAEPKSSDLELEYSSSEFDSDDFEDVDKVIKPFLYEPVSSGTESSSAR